MSRMACLVAMAVLGSCGEDASEPPVLVEHCGVEGPVRVFELPPGLNTVHTQRVGERLYHMAGRDSAGILTETALWSTDLCGGSLTHIADDVSDPFTVERWPGVLFTCLQGAGLHTLDPDGVAPPRPAFRTTSCGLRWSDQGAVSFAPVIDENAVTLLLHPYPEDPRGEHGEPQTLPGSYQGRSVRVVGDQLYALAGEHTLVRIDLADRSATPIQSGVYDFRVSPDGRYLLWQDIVATNTEPGRLTGVVSLRDETSGFSVALGAMDDLLGVDLEWADRGFLLYGEQGERRIYLLPELKAIELPFGVEPDRHGPLADGRWLLESLNGPHWLGLLDPKDGSTIPLFSGRARIYGREAAGVVVLDIPMCCDVGQDDDEGPLWYVPFDGSGARSLADRVGQFSFRLGRSRVISILDMNTERLGKLVSIDLGTRAEHVIDDQVQTSTTTVHPGDDGPLITYSVLDGERSGVWIAHLVDAP